MQKVYEEICEIGNSIFVVEADGVEINEMVCVEKKDGTKLFGSVMSFENNRVTIQAMGSTAGVSTGDRVKFLKRAMSVCVEDSILGRVMNSMGEPIDNGPPITGLQAAIGGPSINPVNRVIPHNLIATNIPMIDMFNCLVESQKIPIFSVAGEPYNQLLMRIAAQTSADVIMIGGMSLRQDDIHYIIESAKSMGALEKTAIFIHRAFDSAAECVLIPDMVLSAAEQHAQQGKKVLVLLTDMTAFADALKELAIALDQVPSNRGYPGSLYSDLASRYEKAVDFEGSGSITIISVTTMPGDDVTSPCPDNTGYITEGQFYLRNGRIEPFGSLSRLKQNAIGGKQSRDDHGDLMNYMIRLYAEALRCRELEAMGFKLSKWDNKLMKYADLFEMKMMDLEVNISLLDALDLGWEILKECFDRDEVGIKAKILDKYWEIG